MIARCARCAPLLVVSFVASLAVVACGGGGAEKPTPAATTKKPDAKAPQDDAKETTKVEGKQDPVPDEQESKGGPSDGIPANDAADDGAEGADAAAEEGEGAEDAAAEGEPAEAEADAAGEAGEEEAAGDDAADDGAADDGAAGAGKDAAALIKEARTTKTTDERAIAALAEAEEAGATIKVLARAAKARADYLYKDPDRAKVFYEWSAAKDEDYAEPVFALAKQKAVTGDVEDVVKLLKQVSERKGGKELLEQIDFDPTWDIVKDDPDVRALL